MKLRRLVLATCFGLPIVAACTLYKDTGTPDPGLYWGWICPDGGTPVDASAPIDYVASGTCGDGGPFALYVDGCEMFGSWSALGLSNVQTTQYASSPGLGGWSVTASGGTEDSGVSLTCTAKPAEGADLTVTCSSAATAIACQSTLTLSRD